MPTVKEIIKKYLQEKRFEGLVDPNGECGCPLDDICPCGNDFSNCEPAKWRKCSDCDPLDFADCESEGKPDGCFYIPKEETKEEKPNG